MAEQKSGGVIYAKAVLPSHFPFYIYVMYCVLRRSCGSGLHLVTRLVSELRWVCLDIC